MSVAPHLRVTFEGTVTPGPWRASKPTGTVGILVWRGDEPDNANYKRICRNVSNAADAALIAAAPDLLAVAEFFLRGIEGGHIKCASYIDFDPNAESLDIKSPADRLRAAISKARGNDD